MNRELSDYVLAAMYGPRIAGWRIPSRTTLGPSRRKIRSERSHRRRLHMSLHRSTCLWRTLSACQGMSQVTSHRVLNVAEYVFPHADQVPVRRSRGQGGQRNCAEQAQELRRVDPPRHGLWHSRPLHAPIQLQGALDTSAILWMGISCLQQQISLQHIVRKRD